MGQNGVLSSKIHLRLQVTQPLLFLAVNVR